MAARKTFTARVCRDYWETTIQDSDGRSYFSGSLNQCPGCCGVRVWNSFVSPYDCVTIPDSVFTDLVDSVVKVCGGIRIIAQLVVKLADYELEEGPSSETIRWVAGMQRLEKAMLESGWKIASTFINPNSDRTVRELGFSPTEVES